MTENVEASLREERITFRDADGRVSAWQVRYAQSPPRTAGGLITCRVTSDTGVIAVRRWVPEALLDDPVCEELEHEVRAGVRLLDRYGDQYPDELVKLIGYNLDVAEPFVLVSPVRGQPVADFRDLRPDARDSFQISLLRGLVYLADAGVLHRGISGSTVYWDGDRAQLRDFGSARIAIRADEGPAYSPSLGARDVEAAGSLILQLATGRPGLSGQTALEGRGQALRDLLDGVFADRPEARPSARMLLARLNVAVHSPDEDQTALWRFEEGRQRFDEELRVKWPARQPALPPPPVPVAAPASTGTARTAGCVISVIVFFLVAVIVTLIVVLVSR